MKILKQAGAVFVGALRALVVLGVVSWLVLIWFGALGLAIFIMLALAIATGALLG
jgi:hypothetical protein